MQAWCAQEAGAAAVNALGLGLAFLGQGIQGWLGVLQGWTWTGYEP